MDASPTLRFLRGAAMAALALTLAACTAAPPTEPAEPTGSASSEPASAPPADSEEAAAIRSTVEQLMEDLPVRAVIVQVRRGDDVVLTQAWGESMASVPATTDMHFRSGAVSIPQMSTVLLQLVDEGTVTLDDTLATWLPDVPNADRVTLGQLAQMTSGYADYVQDAGFLEELYRDPFRQWEPEELYRYGTDKPLFFEPGTNWAYAHTNYVLLGLALEEITGEPLADVLRERILEPLGMEQTEDPGTPELLIPALHAFDSERRVFLGVPGGVPFIEESTYWNPSWTLARGSIQNTNVADMATVIRAVGRGELLSDESHELMIAPTLRGRTTAVEGCPTCFPHGEFYTYGYGIVLSGDWLLQNPAFHGYAGVAGYLPSDDVTVAVAVTYADEAFDETGIADANLANPVFSAIAGVVAPDASTPGR